MKALVTRPAEDAAPLAQALAARGIEPLLEPMLAICPLPDAAARLAPRLAGAQAVLFTSANGVRAFAAAATIRDLPAFAVGETTAAAARSAGFARVESADGDVEGLARLAQARLRPAGGPLLHAAGSAIAGDLAGRLAAAGFELRRAVLYEARPATTLGAAATAALQQGGIDLALFFSPRTAAAFVRLAAAARLADMCRGIVAMALSPAVAACLGDLAWRSIRTAGASTQPSLLAALDAALAEGAIRGKVSGEREPS